MEPISCFMVEPTGGATVALRRYTKIGVGEDRAKDCPGGGGYHDALYPLEGIVPVELDDECIFRVDTPEVADDDPRWPTVCSKCQMPFIDGQDPKQVFTEVLYGDAAGNTWTQRELPPGAIWEAKWMGDWARINGSGPTLVIKLPGGHEWTPGGQASNCGRKGEPLGSHDCWCVHGTAPALTIDKNPEPGRTTCTAGAGSIASRNWHGFLRDGKLVE